MAAFCVGAVCTSIEQYPEERDLIAARDEERRRVSTEAIRRTLTLPPNVGPYARLPALRPGEPPS
jgi:hypothetical protein